MCKVFLFLCLLVLLPGQGLPFPTPCPPAGGDTLWGGGKLYSHRRVWATTGEWLSIYLNQNSTRRCFDGAQASKLNHQTHTVVVVVAVVVLVAMHTRYLSRKKQKNQSTFLFDCREIGAAVKGGPQSDPTPLSSSTSPACLPACLPACQGGVVVLMRNVLRYVGMPLFRPKHFCLPGG